MNEEEELQRLRRRAERLAREQQRLLDQIERAKAEALPPEERRRRFRIIRGGAVAVAAVLAWLWTCRPRPVLTMLTVGLLGMLAVESPQPQREPEQAPPPAVAPESSSPRPSSAPPRPSSYPEPGRGAEMPEPSGTVDNPEPAPTLLPTSPTPTRHPPSPSTPTPTSPPNLDPTAKRCLRAPLLDLKLCLT